MPDEELLLALDGHLDGKLPREIAADLTGAARVAADWYPDSGLRSLVRRRIRKSVMLMEDGYRQLAAGRQV